MEKPPPAPRGEARDRGEVLLATSKTLIQSAKQARADAEQLLRWSEEVIARSRKRLGS